MHLVRMKGYAMYRYFIFDFDGTVANSGAIVNRILRELVADTKVSMPSARDYKHREELPLLQRIRLFLFIRRIGGTFRDRYAQNLSHIPPFAGMLELLVAMHDAGYPLVFITSNTEENIRRFFHIHDFEPPVQVLSAKGLFGKHNAIRAFLRRYRCSRGDVLYIGDEIRDIKACRKAGIDIAFVRWGLDGGEDVSAYRPKFIVKSPTKLRELLLKTGYTE
jgi:phosphoglycolate phosphatase